MNNENKESDNHHNNGNSDFNSNSDSNRNNNQAFASEFKHLFAASSQTLARQKPRLGDVRENLRRH